MMRIQRKTFRARRRLAVRRRPALAYQTGRERGRILGQQDGRSEGVRIGFAETAAARLLQDGIRPRDAKLMYVTAGIGVPYPALDAAIIAALWGLVRELIVVSPDDQVAQIAAERRPDWMLALNGVVLPAEQVAAVRELGIRTAVWFTDDPYYTDWTDSIARRYDDVFTLEAACLPFYRELGCSRVHHLPFAADPAVFFPRPAHPSQRRDICFIGTAYRNRLEMVDALAPFLKSRRTLISGWWWDRLSRFRELKEKIALGQWLSPEDTAAWYSAAKIVVNLHRESDDPEVNRNGRGVPALSVNPRTFEISACGTLQVCDERDELTRLYEPGKEIVTYRTAEELQEKLQYYLEHEEERREIALQGYLRTLREHTYRRRLDRMLQIALG